MIMLNKLLTLSDIIKLNIYLNYFESERSQHYGFTKAN